MSYTYPATVNAQSDAKKQIIMKKDEKIEGLVGLERCIEIVFPDPKGRPAKRSFQNWQARGMIPYRKVGRRVFFDPDEVRQAIDQQFKIRISS